MTVSELLALLGLAWARLLLYPGGLAALALVWLCERRQPTRPYVPAALPAPQRLAVLVLPWLGLALLPLPGAQPLSRSLDVVVALALLEWPLLAWIASEARLGCPHTRRQLAALLNGWPPLVLALTLLATSRGSLDMAELFQPPDWARPAPAALHWIGALGCGLALPPLLGCGPFAAPAPADLALRVGLRLRVLGLLALAALPWLPLLGQHPWLLPLPPLALAGLLWAYQRACRHQLPRHHANAYLLLSGLLLLALLAAALLALTARLS